MVHASFSVPIEDIFLNSSFMISLNKAFNALLLKLAALILASSQSTDTSFGFGPAYLHSLPHFLI